MSGEEKGVKEDATLRFWTHNLNAVFSLFQFLQTPVRFVLGALLYRRGTVIGGGGIGHRRE